MQKQGFKFKLHTKVLSGSKTDNGVQLEVEGVKDGKKETVRGSDSLGGEILLKLIIRSAGMRHNPLTPAIDSVPNPVLY